LARSSSKIGKYAPAVQRLWFSQPGSMGTTGPPIRSRSDRM
jgi:hypothetical protein